MIAIIRLINRNEPQKMINKTNIIARKWYPVDKFCIISDHP